MTYDERIEKLKKRVNYQGNSEYTVSKSQEAKAHDKLTELRNKYSAEAKQKQQETSSGTTTTASSPVNNSAYNSMSYEGKKDYLKDEKSDALKEKLSAGASKIASFFSSDDEKKELANSRYEQASSEYDKYKNALDLLKQNKWEETQKDNTVLLDSNTEVQQLVKLMYDTEKQTQTVQRQSSATFSNNPLMMITSSESMDSQQKQVIENEKIISEAQNKLKEMGYDAYSLLDTYTRNINAEQAQVIDKQVAEIANEKPILANAVSVGLNSMQATALPDMIVNTIQELQTGDYRPLDTNSLAFAPTRAMNTIRETTSKNIQDDYDSEFGKNTADFLYQTGMSMADSLSTMPLTVVPGARSAVIGASAMTQGIVDATDRGVSSGKALLTGLAQGTSEVVFEALSLGNLKTLKSSGKTGVKNFVKDVLKQSFVEGSEETATEISNIITDKIINDDKSSIDQTYNSYVEAGYSEEEAKQQTAKDTALQVLQAFAGGAISGGVFGAGASTINSVNMNNAYRSQGEAIKNADQVSQLVNKGLEQDTSSPAYKIAMQMLTKDEVADAYTTPTNENVSSKKLGQLNQEVVKENDISAFSTLVKGEKEAQTLTESFTKLINDENLSRKEINTLMTNETSRKALSQLTNIDAISNENKKMSNSKLAENLAADYRNTSMLKLDYLQRPTEYATTKSGQTVILDGIEENKNGNITVKTLDNQVLNLDEINVQNEDTKQLLDYSKTLDDKTSKAFVEGYNYHKYNGTVNDYFAGTQEIIKAQVQGKSFDEAYNIANNVSSITKEQAENIYFNSVLDQMVKNTVRQKNNANIINQKKKAEFVNAISSKVKPGTTVLAQNLNDYEKSEVKVIEKIAKKYGREVVIVDDTEELGYASSNGFYENGKIVLAANNEAGIMSAYFGHELFHDLKKNSPQMAQELQDFVISTLKEQTSYNYEQRFESLKELYKDEIDGLSDKETTDFINEEITANACFTVFTNEDNLKKLVKENKTLAEKIRDFFINFRKTIENALVKLSKSNKEYDALKDNVDAVNRILDLFDAALNEEQKNNTIKNDSVTKYSFAGENANNSNKISLNYAQSLEKQGVNTEKIRQRTGWFRGYDEKWRFEINDKDMKINKQGLYSRNPDIRRLVELEQKAYFDGTATEKEVYELQQLSKNLKGVKITPNRLGDIMIHTELFEAYPQLADYKITYIDSLNSNGELGSYSNNEIQLNRFLTGDKLKSAFIHEIQHAIQHIENFETGTNPIIAGSYENYKNNAGEIEASDVSNRVDYTDEQRKNIRPNIDRENVRFFTDDIIPYENIINYDIEKTSDNRSVVVIKEDILKGVNKKNWVNTVKKNIKNKFINGIPISGKLVKVNVISRNELTNSKNTKYLRSTDGTIYADKLRSTNNLDEIILASTNYINEDLNHKRKDNIIQFARGNVLLEIGENQYSASVIIGYTSTNEMLLYDIIDFTRTKFKIKKEDTSIAMQKNAGSYRNEVSSNNSVSDSNENVKFSLKESVEETDKLLAVHNTSEDKLIKTLEFGGFPMPSIAIMKANMAGSQGFGDITIVFNKETIDPRKRENKVYSADAYTPTKVKIESKLNTDKVNDLYFKAIDYENANRNIPFALKSIRLEKGNLADRINGSSSFESFMKNLENDYEMKQFFLSESDNQVKEYVQKETRTEVSDADAELYDYLNDKMKDYEFVLSPKLFKERYEALFDKHYSEYFKDKFNFSTEKIENILNNMNLFDKRILLDKARRYRINGKETVKVEDDIKATEQKIDERINGNDYKKWLYNLFDGIVEKQGIQRENVDPYTSRGDRKSFEQLHYDVTLENIVKAMKEQQTQGKALFGNSLYGSVQTEYSTISEIKDNSDRLQDINQYDFDNQRKEFRARFYEIADSMSKNDNNTSVEDLLCEAVMVSKTKSGMANYIEKEGKGWINFKESAVDDLINLVSDIRQMPTRYFEAKPQRAVKFNEIAKVVLPDNASTELKTALNDNNVDYIEYSAGDESARIEAINSLDEAKFSKKESNTNYEDLLRENEELSELNENLQRMLELVSSENNELREQFKIKIVRTQKESSVNKVSAYLRKQYESNYDKSTLTSRLAGLYDYITNVGEDIDSDYIWNVSKDIATDLLSDTRIKDTTVYDENKELRDYIRKTTIQVPENVRNDMAEYNDFRKRNFGTMRLSNDKGTPLDTIYSELSNINPAYFPADAVLSEQLEHIENFFNSTEAVYYNGAEMIAEENGLSLDEYSNIVASDIFDQYFNVPEVQSFVSEKNQEEMELLHQEYKAQLEDVRKLYRERYEEQLRSLREENQQRLEKLKDKNDKTIAKLNERHLDQIAKQKAHFKDVSKRGTQRRNASKLRESIRRSLKKIAKLGASPDKKNHIPNSIIDSVKSLADAINLDNTKKDELISTKLNQIKTSFDTAKKNNDYKEMSEAYNDFIENEIIELQARTEGKTLKQLTNEDLESIDKILKATVKAISNINKLFKKDRTDTVNDYAASIKLELSNFSKDKITDGTLRNFAYNSMKPEYFFEYLGSDTFLELYNDLRKGEDVWVTDVNEAKRKADGLRNKYGWSAWDDDTITFSTISGDIELNLQERLAIYANSLGEHTKNHLLGGGFKYQSKKPQGFEKLKKQKNDNQAHRLSEEDIITIVATLTDEQTSYVKDMIDYMSTVMARKGNEVSKELYDVELFKEATYYPAKVDRESIVVSSKEVRPEKQIKNAGFTNVTVINAKQPVILIDFDTVWATHIDEMSKYHAFVLPLDNFDRVFNSYQVVDNEYRSVKENIKNSFGSKAVNYIDDFIRDINGGVVQEPGADIMSKLIGLFKKNAVFASMSVVVQQPSAIARALAEIDVKYLAKATGKGFDRNLYNEMKHYAPIAQIKEMGYFDTNMAQSTVDYLNKKSYEGLQNKVKAFVKDGTYRDDALSFFASKGDEITWTQLWQAVKYEIADKNSKSNKEDQLKLAGERFTDIISKTQVYDSVFSRSGLMRSRDTAVKNAMAFMAEPTTSLNMLTNAIIQTKRGKMSKVQGAKVLGSLVAASIMNSLLQSIVTSARDVEPEDDDEWLNIYLAHIVPNLINNINPLNQIAFVKDIVNIFKGYDVSRADMNLFSDFADAVKKLDSDNATVTEKITGLSGAISAFFGFPLKNIIRDLKAAFNTGQSIFNGFEVNSTESYEIYEEEMNQVFGFELFKPDYDKAVKAIKKGEYEGYEKYAETVYASSQAYNLLYEVLKKYGYNSLEYKKAEELCIDVKKDNGTENPNPLSSIKNKCIKEYSELKQNGTYAQAEEARQRCIQVYGSADDVVKALEKYEKGNAE